jgi:hypothetical protein
MKFCVNKNRKQNIEHCDFVLIKITDDKVPIMDIERTQLAPKSVTSRLTSSLYLVDPSTMYEALLDLAYMQFGLHTIKVTGVPMREKDGEAATRALYHYEFFLSNR